MIPSHAYIPGRTPRHPEDLFDPLKATVRSGMGAADLEASAAWLVGLRYYRAGYYWESHEVLEAVWMAARANSAERRVAQAVIQLSNGRLKAKMGRANATRRLAGIVRAHVADARLGPEPVLGLTRDWLLAEAAALETLAQNLHYIASSGSDENCTSQLTDS